jgi:hypothetical protein
LSFSVLVCCNDGPAVADAVKIKGSISSTRSPANLKNFSQSYNRDRRSGYSVLAVVIFLLQLSR